MIARRTIYFFLLALLLGLGIKLWTMSLRGPCDAYLAGDEKASPTVMLEPDGHAREVSCDDWVLRQPTKVQVMIVFDGVLAAVFLCSVCLDGMRWLDRRVGLRT